MQYLGYIPYDEKLPQAVMQQKPVSLAYPDSTSSRAMLDLAMILDNGENKQSDYDAKGLSGLFTKLFHGKIG